MDGFGSHTRINVPPVAGVDAHAVPPTTIRSIVKKIGRSIAIALVVQNVYYYVIPYLKAPLERVVPESYPAQKEYRNTMSEKVDKMSEGDYSADIRNISPLWKAPTTLNIELYLSENLIFDSTGEVPFLCEKGIRIGNWSDIRQSSTLITFTESVLKNGTLYAHLFVYETPGAIEDRSRSSSLKEIIARTSYPLTKYMPYRAGTKTKNLMGVSSKEALQVNDAIANSSILSYYHPNFTVSLVGDASTMPMEAVHPVIKPYINIDPERRSEDGLDGYFLPIIYQNDFWLLKDEMHPVNATVSTVPFFFEINQISLLKLQIYRSLDIAVKQQTSNFGSSGGEFEEFKRILLETNIWLLGATMAVSALHSIFEILAFKNEIMHFRSRKDNTGLSVNAILMNVCMQVIVLLYLLDNQENASYVILAGQGFGILVEAWKITKVVDVQIVRVPHLLPYRICFGDTRFLNQSELETKAHDADATKYLLWVSAPLLVLYALYSLAYQEHKGWWSFVITTLVGFVYFYGFLTMIPSLYINYKLKSVAHMSSRALTYKFLNTIVDDGFAFIIKQPFLSRLAAFRDDVVFIVFLYQMFIYRVDTTRTNEFGQIDSNAETSSKKTR